MHRGAPEEGTLTLYHRDVVPRFLANRTINLALLEDPVWKVRDGWTRLTTLTLQYRQFLQITEYYYAGGDARLTQQKGPFMHFNASFEFEVM
jgi:hypothetical protein